MMDRIFDFGQFQLRLESVPELIALHGVPQPEKHHPEIDTLSHIFLVMDQAVRLTGEPMVHFAALLHDLGKGLTPVDKLPSHPGHEEAGVPLVRAVCDRIPNLPEEWETLARLVCQYHTHCHRCEEMTPRALRRFFNDVGALTHPERFEMFLLACEADARGRTGFENRPYDQPRYLREQRNRMAEVVKSQAMTEVKKRSMTEALSKRVEELPLDARLEILRKFCQDCGEIRELCGCASGV